MGTIIFYGLTKEQQDLNLIKIDMMYDLILDRTNEDLKSLSTSMFSSF